MDAMGYELCPRHRQPNLYQGDTLVAEILRNVVGGISISFAPGRYAKFSVSFFWAKISSKQRIQRKLGHGPWFSSVFFSGPQTSLNWCVSAIFGTINQLIPFIRGIPGIHTIGPNSPPRPKPLAESTGPWHSSHWHLEDGIPVTK